MRRGKVYRVPYQALQGSSDAFVDEAVYEMV